MFRPIYEPRTKAREYCDLAVNIYTECNLGCSYCWSRSMSRRFGTPWTGTVKPRRDILKGVREQLMSTKSKPIRDKKIMLCFTCDPYPADIDTGITREIIKAIKNSGNHVQILTKGGNRAERDFDLLNSNDSFGVTVTGAHDTIEPRAASEYGRLKVLKSAKEKGIKTWVSCEPVYEPSAIYALIKLGDYVDMFRIGKLNYERSWIDWSEFGRECERLCKQLDRNYYIKEDLRMLMGKESEV